MVDAMRKTTFAVVGLGLGLVLAFGLGESALRLYDLVQGRDPLGAQLGENISASGRYQPHPYMGYTLKPGHVGEGVNPLGFRGVPVSPDKPDDVFRILCLGGSTTYGSRVPAYRAYPARLQTMLTNAQRDDPSLRYEVLNCGVPGYTTAESLVNLSLRLSDFKADALVIYHGINDARLIQVGGFRSDYSHMRSSWRYPVISPVEWTLLRHSRLFFRLFGETYVKPSERRLEHLVFVDSAKDPHPSPSWEGVNPKGIATYVRNLRNLIAVAQEQGIEPVLTTFASSTDNLDGPGYEDVLAAMNLQVRRLARERNLPIIGLNRVLSPQSELFSDYIHLNEAGCLAQARAIYGQARAQGLWHLR
ncbi:MAG: lysophospholipase L1-like esterase [Pseudohongiellaceae bacterium]|jgi:lysophospholipase L1-like esterase